MVDRIILYGPNIDIGILFQQVHSRYLRKLVKDLLVTTKLLKGYLLMKATLS